MNPDSPQVQESPSPSKSDGANNSSGLGRSSKGSRPVDPIPGSQPLKRRPLILPFWMEAFLFGASLVLYGTVLFAVFAPLPLVILGWARGRLKFYLAVALNAALVSGLLGKDTLGVYAILVLAPSIGLFESFRARLRPTAVGFVALGAMIAMALGVELGLAYRNGRSLGEEVRGQLDVAVEVLDRAQQLVEKEAGETRLERSAIDLDSGARKAFLLQEFPAAALLSAMFVVFLNLLLVLRLSPLRLRETLRVENQYFRRWKVPSFWLVPTLAFGAMYAFGKGTIELVGWNGAQVCLALYIIQGLSLLSFVLDLWRLRGFFRTFAIVSSLWVGLPFLLGVGFFDQWFDFRSKFGQG